MAVKYGRTVSRLHVHWTSSSGTTELSKLLDQETSNAENAKEVDLNGSTLFPGFQDAHIHLGIGGSDLLQCNLLGLDSVERVAVAIANYSSKHTELEWVLGGGWDQHMFPTGPTSQLLDSLVGGRKALFHAHSRHAAWASSAALEAAGIDKYTPDPENGVIERDVSGKPTGLLLENAIALFDSVIPESTHDMRGNSILAAQDHLLRLGVTSIQDALVGTGLGVPDHHAAYMQLLRTDALLLRVTAALWWDPALGTEQICNLIERRSLLESAGPEGKVIADTVKLMIDGTNLVFMDREAVFEAVRALDSSGFTVHFHSYGEASTMHILDAIESAQKLNLSSGRRHHIAHLMVVREEDFERFARLNVTANIQGLRSDGPVPHELIRPTQLSCDPHRREYAFARMQMAGTRLAAGSDWPVSSADPLDAAFVASSRLLRDGTAEIDSLDTLDLAAVFSAYTVGSAYVNGRAENTGRVARGFLADLAVLDGDPFSQGAGAREVKVVETWIGGTRRF